MSQVTIISEGARTIAATLASGRVLIDPKVLPDALGWELKPDGLCRDDTCVPVRDVGSLGSDGQLDVAAVAGALGRPVVVDSEAGIVAVAVSAEQRHQALDGLQAPAFTLADLDGVPHELREWRGTKKLLVAFSTW